VGVAFGPEDDAAPRDMSGSPALSASLWHRPRGAPQPLENLRAAAQDAASFFKDTRLTLATLYEHLADGVHGSELFGD